MSLKGLTAKFNDDQFISKLKDQSIRVSSPLPRGRMLLARQVSRMTLEELRALPEPERVKLVHNSFHEKLAEHEKPKAHIGFEKHIAVFKENMHKFVHLDSGIFKGLNEEIREQVNQEILGIQYNLQNGSLMMEKRARKLDPEDQETCQQVLNESIVLRAKQVLQKTRLQPESPKKPHKKRKFMDAEVRKLADMVGIRKAVHLKLFMESSRKLASKLSQEITNPAESKLPSISRDNQHRRHLSHESSVGSNVRGPAIQNFAGVVRQPKYESSVFSTLSRRLSRPRRPLPSISQGEGSQFSPEDSEFVLRAIPKHFKSALDISTTPRYQSEFEPKMEFEGEVETGKRDLSWLGEEWKEPTQAEGLPDSPELFRAPKLEADFLSASQSAMQEPIQSDLGEAKASGLLQKSKSVPKVVESGLRRYMASGDPYFEDYLKKHRHPSFGGRMENLQHKIEHFNEWKTVQDRRVLERVCQVGQRLKKLKKELSNPNNMENLERRDDNLAKIKSLIAREERTGETVHRRVKRRPSLKSKLLMAVT